MQKRELQKNAQAKAPANLKADIIKSKQRALSKEEQMRLNKMLWDAAEKGKTKRVERLLKAGANVWAIRGAMNALMLAAQNGHTETCALLLEKGAVLRPYGSLRNALHYAAEDGHTGTCAFLIGKGANIMEKDKLDRTALMHAEKNGHIQTAKFLKSIELLAPMLSGKPAISLIDLLSGDMAISFMTSFGECLSI